MPPPIVGQFYDSSDPATKKKSNSFASVYQALAACPHKVDKCGAKKKVFSKSTDTAVDQDVGLTGQELT